VSSSPLSARWHKRDASSPSAISPYLTKSIRPHLLLWKRFPRLVPLHTLRDERAGASEALAVCDPFSRSAVIRFLGSDYVTARSRSAASSSFRRGRELHDDHLPASTMVHDFEQRTMATSANGASDALGMGPSAGYILFSSLCQFMVFMCYVVFVTFYIPWIYVILVLAGMFRLSWLYVFIMILAHI
jgi:hypothetical protein